VPASSRRALFAWTGLPPTQGGHTGPPLRTDTSLRPPLPVGGVRMFGRIPLKGATPPVKAWEPGCPSMSPLSGSGRGAGGRYIFCDILVRCMGGHQEAAGSGAGGKDASAAVTISCRKTANRCRFLSTAPASWYRLDPQNRKADGSEADMKLEYPYTLEPQKSGGFVVQFANIEEVFTEGATRRSVLSMPPRC